MTEANININVRHKLGPFGKFTVWLACQCNRVGIPMPLALLCFVVNHDSYVSVNHGPFERMTFDIGPREFTSTATPTGGGS